MLRQLVRWLRHARSARRPGRSSCRRPERKGPCVQTASTLTQHTHPDDSIRCLEALSPDQHHLHVARSRSSLRTKNDNAVRTHVLRLPLSAHRRPRQSEGRLLKYAAAASSHQQRKDISSLISSSFPSTGASKTSTVTSSGAEQFSSPSITTPLQSVHPIPRGGFVDPMLPSFLDCCAC